MPRLSLALEPSQLYTALRRRCLEWLRDEATSDETSQMPKDLQVGSRPSILQQARPDSFLSGGSALALIQVLDS
jgi:hypothetical protein